MESGSCALMQLKCSLMQIIMRGDFREERKGQATSSLVSPVTGFALQPLSNDSPFALSSLTATAPAAQSSAEDMDASEEDGVDFLKDGEVIMNAGGDEAMEDGEEEPPRPPIDATAEGHTATIRDVLWFDNVLITGGEDSRLCLWSTEQPAQVASSSSAASSSLKVRQHTTKGPTGAPLSSSASPPAAENSKKSHRQYTPY
jgi:WD40 repeat protein